MPQSYSPEQFDRLIKEKLCSSDEAPFRIEWHEIEIHLKERSSAPEIKLSKQQVKYFLLATIGIIVVSGIYLAFRYFPVSTTSSAENADTLFETTILPDTLLNVSSDTTSIIQAADTTSLAISSSDTLSKIATTDPVIPDQPAPDQPKIKTEIKKKKDIVKVIPVDSSAIMSEESKPEIPDTSSGSRTAESKVQKKDSLKKDTLTPKKPKKGKGKKPSADSISSPPPIPSLPVQNDTAH